MKKRWYDRYPEFAGYLEQLRDVPSKKRKRLVAGVMECIKEQQTELIDAQVIDFPLEPFKRRWYDADPCLWLVVNGLRNADPAIITQVTAYLRKRMSTKK